MLAARLLGDSGYDNPGPGVPGLPYSVPALTRQGVR
jgi:hypothetical protein